MRPVRIGGHCRHVDPVVAHDRVGCARRRAGARRSPHRGGATPIFGIACRQGAKRRNANEVGGSAIQFSVRRSRPGLCASLRPSTRWQKLPVLHLAADEVPGDDPLSRSLASVVRLAESQPQRPARPKMPSVWGRDRWGPQSRHSVAVSAPRTCERSGMGGDGGEATMADFVAVANVG